MRTLNYFSIGVSSGLLSTLLVSGCGGDGSQSSDQPSEIEVLQMGATATSPSGLPVCPGPGDECSDNGETGCHDTCGLAETQVPAATPRLRNGANGHWYQRFDGSLSWHQAVFFCWGLGGYLATITSDGESQFVWDQLGAESPQTIWLGATDVDLEGHWVWVTGEPFTWTHWAEGEPNNVCSRGEDYLQLIFSGHPSGSFWGDADSGVGPDGTGGSCGCNGCTDTGLVSTICEWNARPGRKHVPDWKHGRGCEGAGRHPDCRTEKN